MKTLREMVDMAVRAANRSKWPEAVVRAASEKITKAYGHSEETWEEVITIKIQKEK